MAAAGGLIQEMTNVSLKYIIVLVLLQFIIAANGHVAIENDEVYLHQIGKREANNSGAYDTGGGKTTLQPTPKSAGTTTTPKPNQVPEVTTKQPELTSTTGLNKKTTTTTTTTAPTIAPKGGIKKTTTVPIATTLNGATTEKTVTATPPSTLTPNPTTTTNAAATPNGTTTTMSTTTLNAAAKPTGTIRPPGTSTSVPKDEDNKYYSLLVQDKKEDFDFDKYWVDIEKDPKFNDTYKPAQYKSLIRRKAMNVSLPWPMVYYGHKVKMVTLAAGGFIHTNPFTKPSLTVAQNIAPLMSDLSRSSTDNMISGIFMVYNDDITVFEWREMEQYQHNNSDGSVVNDTFTFQLHLLVNGKIRFLYKSHPTPVADISEELHDVKAGISDGYFVKPKTGLEVLVPYGMIDISDHLKNGVVITFTPKPTCIQQSSCEKCIKVPDFHCTWCADLKRCSDGYDPYRQSWLDNNCTETGASTCSTTPVDKTTKEPTTKPGSATTVKPPVKPTKRPKPTKVPCVDDGTGKCKPSKHAPAKGKAGTNVGAIVAVILLVFIIFGAGGWFWYAYKNPTSSSGMCLMTAKTSCCKKGRISRSSKDYQAFMESDTESLPL
ncbi:plexin domain-containing protein 2-like isoform X2 [Lineus longissimus]|uniref:plexin domain-containing protein 2-like isoform X2 n=1 Tax=Lineus longissimus TaxID=88925 RepID=UPI002B4E2BB4